MGRTIINQVTGELLKAGGLEKAVQPEVVDIDSLYAKLLPEFDDIKVFDDSTYETIELRVRKVAEQNGFLDDDKEYKLYARLALAVGIRVIDTAVNTAISPSTLRGYLKKLEELKRECRDNKVYETKSLTPLRRRIRLKLLRKLKTDYQEILDRYESTHEISQRTPGEMMIDLKNIESLKEEYRKSDLGTADLERLKQKIRREFKNYTIKNKINELESLYESSKGALATNNKIAMDKLLEKIKATQEQPTPKDRSNIATYLFLESFVNKLRLYAENIADRGPRLSTIEKLEQYQAHIKEVYGKAIMHMR